MNKVILMGRLTRDPDIRSSQGENSITVARFTIAVDRRFKRDSDQTADFISCVAFGKTAEFFERYIKQGTKVCVEGRIQTGSYTNKDGNKVYTTDVVVENAEFAESKSAQEMRTGNYQQQNQYQQQYGGQPQQYGQYSQPAQQFSQPAQQFSQPQQPYGQQSQQYGQPQPQYQQSAPAPAPMPAPAAPAVQQPQSQSTYSLQSQPAPAQPAQESEPQGTATVQTAEYQSYQGSAQESRAPFPAEDAAGEGFMSIPDGLEDEGLPFN